MKPQKHGLLTTALPRLTELVSCESEEHREGIVFSTTSAVEGSWWGALVSCEARVLGLDDSGGCFHA